MGVGATLLACVPLRPPPPLYSAGMIGAHNPIVLGSLDQGAESRAQLGRWTESVEINTNTYLPLLLLPPPFCPFLPLLHPYFLHI